MTPYVDEVASGVYAFVQPDGGWMVNNTGIVVDTRISVPSVWPDMVAFHGGPIACHA